VHVPSTCANIDVAMETKKRHMREAINELSRAYPEWAKSFHGEGVGQSGEWRHDRGPPFVKLITLFSGEGVNHLGGGNVVRRILGVKMAPGKKCDLRSCDHAWTGNSYLHTFDGSQFRFLYRHMCSVLVIPPFRAAGPILGANGIYRLRHYIEDGGNTLLVTGGVGNVLFINANVLTSDGGYDLEHHHVDGPFEAQPTIVNTPFEALPVTLPGSGAVGVKKYSLPRGAVSFYESEDSSVIFMIPVKTGRIIYLGYEFDEPDLEWAQALVAATMFADFVKH